MIKKSIFFALILLVIYNIILSLWKPSYYIPQSFFQDNVIRAQKFIYDSNNIENVIVGSSLSAKMDMNVLPEGFYNLSLRAQTIYEGLEIIKRSGAKPNTIFIESNVILKDPDVAFCENLFTPFISTIKHKVPALQEVNEPVGFLTLLGFEFFSKSNPELAAKVKRNFGINAKSGSTTLDESFEEKAKIIEGERNPVFKRIIDERVKEFSSIPDVEIVNQRIALLKQYIEYFLKKGTRIVFFEMPVESEIHISPLANFTRNKVDNNFISHHFIFLSAPDCRYFKTKDGMHLIDESATLYSMYFNEKVNEIIKHKILNKT